MREMKDSGISWVGEIPKEWSVNRAKYCFVNTKEIAGCRSDRYERLALTMNGVIKRSKDDSNGLQPEKFETYQILRPDELVFKLIDLQNVSTSRVGLSPYLGLVSPAYIILKSNKRVLPAFAEKYFLMLWKNQIFNALGDAGVRSNLNSKDLLELSIPFPSLAEQQRIAEFLDRECGKIDGLKADIQAQIDTLEQYKRSVITEAVTHGLNPSASMKDSGIPWVGEIPAKWAVLPIYSVYGERKRKNVFGTEQNLLSLSYGKVIRKDINTNGGLLPSNYNGYNIIEKNDIIIRPTDLQNDRTSLRTGLVKEHGIITSAYIALKPKNRVSSKFYHYLLHSYDVKKVFYNMGNGVRQGLNYGEFAKLMVYYPPLEEQQEIADYLDNKCAEIEQIIADKKSQIGTLDGYKKSLIFEYVTGKKEIAL